MEMFRKKRKFSAVMERIQGKVVKGKPGSSQDSTQKTVIVLTLAVQMTAKLKELLDPRIAALLKLDGKEADRDIPINAIDMERTEYPCVLKVYSKQNFNKDSDPIFTRGGAPDDDAAGMTLTKLAMREGATYLIIQAKIRFGDDAWLWGGRSLGEGECVVEVHPLQQELEFGEKKEGAPE